MATTNIDKQSFGQEGATMLRAADQAVTKVDICAILVVEDTVFDSAGTDWPELSKAVDVNKDGVDEVSVHSADSGTDGAGRANTTASKAAFIATTWPAGITIYGQFTKVKLDSGAVLCYHAA
jgi:hypothetical protein